MSTQKCCDLCEEIIVHKMYFITLTQDLAPRKLNKLVAFTIKPEVYQALADERKKYKEATKYFEICESCKEVLDYLLTMRGANLQMLKNEIKGIISLPLKERTLDDN